MQTKDVIFAVSCAVLLLLILAMPTFAQDTAPVIACGPGFPEPCVTGGSVIQDTLNGAALSDSDAYVAGIEIDSLPNEARTVIMPKGTDCGYESDEMVCHVPASNPIPDTDYEPPAQDQGDNLNAMADPE